MKRIVLSFITVLVLFPLFFNGKLDAVETVTSSDFFSIELFTDTQSPWTKSVPLTVKFRANRSSEKTEISWDAPTGVRIRQDHPQFVSVIKGEVYTYKTFVVPENPGTYNIAVNVTAWEVNTNYTSSSNITIKFDENLVQDPPAADYQTSVLLRNIALGLLGIMLLAALAYGLKLAFLKLKEWLKPPE